MIYCCNICSRYTFDYNIFNSNICISCMEKFHHCLRCKKYYSTTSRQLYIHKEFYCKGGNISHKNRKLIFRKEITKKSKPKKPDEHKLINKKAKELWFRECIQRLHNLSMFNYN